MKQFIIIALIILTGYIGYNSYDIYGKKQYSSSYESKKTASSVKIEKIEFDKEKIEKLNDKIKSLAVDPVFKLKISTFTDNEKQPLFIDSYAPIYQKILQNQRIQNKYLNNNPN